MTAPTALRLFTCAVLLVFIPVNDAQTPTCRQYTYTYESESGLSGSISSPGYPASYGNYQSCYNYFDAPSLSTITITFNALGLEQHATCGYDWIEFACVSNSISRPIRYCGSGYRAPLIFKPCSRVFMRFSSDAINTGSGFSVFFYVEPISCQGNCTPVASGSGYNCTCDANQTPYIAPPYNQCPTGCSDSSNYCACSLPQTTTTTIAPTLPPTTTSYSGCGQSTTNGLRGNITSPNYPYNYNNNQYCNIFIVAPSLSTITITFNVLGLEQHSDCYYDWIELSCMSNSNTRPVRYCGSGYRAPLTIKPCSRVSVMFASDGYITSIGFLVSYDIEPISCQGNCTPVASGSGYNCSCDANQITSIAPPYNLCPTGCTAFSTLCVCSSPHTAPTTTTTTLRPTTHPSFSACRQSTMNGLRGYISSPNYPYSYENNQLCNNFIDAPSLSTITITFDALGLEEHATCGWDWIELSCMSNSISRPVRYCGSGNRTQLILKPCSRVSVRFSSDGVVTGTGFSVSYDIEQIRCQGNCNPVASGSGYNCTCDANQTPYIAPPYNQCPTGCSDSSSYCTCSSPQAVTPASTTTTTTTTTIPSTTRPTTLPSTTTRLPSTTTTVPRTTTTSNSVCGQRTFSGLRGNITSPNYPYSYPVNQFCNYSIVPPSLSSINFTFNVIGIEPHATCNYDWIEFTCESNSIIRQVRYCGSGYRPELSIMACSRVSITFSSDRIYTYSGFSLTYEIEPISCQGNCIPVANGAGYNCSCDANQTPYIAPPYNQCPTGCSDSSTYCICSSPNTTTSRPPSTTTTTTSLPTTRILQSGCKQNWFSSLRGNITSPNYPNYYQNNQFCSYTIVAQSLSSINFTFNVLGLEPHATCGYDWIEFTCESNPIIRPIRYCGSGSTPELSIMPCSRVSMRFSSDKIYTGIGFAVSYDIEPISCQGNCTPVANGAGYNCTCDANQTPFIAPPYNQCPDGCLDSSTYCACSLSFTNATTSPSNTSTEPPYTTPLYSACGQSTFSDLSGNITSPNYPNYYNYQNNQYCNYSIDAPSLSTINFTFHTLGLEYQYSCTYDWIEFTCESNPIIRPIRYCGYGSRPKLSIKPCSRVLVRFSSDRIYTSIGFSVSYEIEPISCQGNCTPVAIGTGYNCTCDANQTPYIAPPFNQCPDGCFNNSTYCACSLSFTNATTSPFNTTTSPPRTTTLYSACGQSTFSGLRGNITSPGYPYSYQINQFCNYSFVTPSLSSINFTFNALGLEQHYYCSYDWIEFTCESNPTIRPVRYCGSGSRPELSIKPCSRVSMRFSSDRIGTGIGFSVSYEIEPISCQGNCTPVANGTGYNCPCDANQTAFIAPPYNQCPDGCFSYSTYCACSQSITNATTSPFNTTISTPRTTTLYSGNSSGNFSQSTTRMPSNGTTTPRPATVNAGNTSQSTTRAI